MHSNASFLHRSASHAASHAAYSRGVWTRCGRHTPPRSGPLAARTPVHPTRFNARRPSELRSPRTAAMGGGTGAGTALAIGDGAVERAQLQVLRSLADSIWPSQPPPDGASEAQARFYTMSAAEVEGLPEQASWDGRSADARRGRDAPPLRARVTRQPGPPNGRVSRRQHPCCVGAPRPPPSGRAGALHLARHCASRDVAHSPGRPRPPDRPVAHSRSAPPNRP
jgi:hypothetical protein